MELDIKTWKTKKFERQEEEAKQICKCGKKATIIKVCFKTKTYYCKICFAQAQITSRINKLNAADLTRASVYNRPLANHKEVRRRLLNQKSLKTCCKFGYWKGHR